MIRLVWLLLFLYLVVFPFGQLLQFRVPILENINVYVADVLVGLTAITWLSWWVSQTEKILPPVSREMLCIFTAFAFSFLFAAHNFSIHELAVGGLYLVRLTFYGLFYFAVWSVIREKQSQKIMRASLVVVGIAVAVLGWAQYLFFPDIRPFAVWGWDEHYLRLVGTFLDPGFTSIILVFVLVMFMAMLTSSRAQRGDPWIASVLLRNDKLLVVLSGFIFISLLFTYSRAGYISFLAGMAAISLLRKNVFVLLGAVVILGAGILLLPQNTSEGTTLSRTTSSFARFESWGDAIKIWETSPVFGVGFNNYQFALKNLSLDYGDRQIPNHGSTGSDSSLLFVLATTGVVGLLLFGHFALRMLTIVWKGRGPISTAFIASFAALFSHSVFLNSLFYPAVMGWMAILFALSVREIMERR